MHEIWGKTPISCHSASIEGEAVVSLESASLCNRDRDSPKSPAYGYPHIFRNNRLKLCESYCSPLITVPLLGESKFKLGIYLRTSSGLTARAYKFILEIFLTCPVLPCSLSHPKHFALSLSSTNPSEEFEVDMLRVILSEALQITGLWVLWAPL